MLLTTHYKEEADRLCSRLAIIDNDTIVIEGQPAELKRSIGADTVILQLESADPEPQRAEARRLLDGLVTVEDIADHSLGLSLAVPNASAEIPSLLRRLDGAGLHIAGCSDSTQPGRCLPDHRRVSVKGADHQSSWVVTVDVGDRL